MKYLSEISPWSSNSENRYLQLKPIKETLHGEVNVPGSKSLTNRALIIAGLAKGESEIEGILKSDDSYWCIEALKNLGVKVDLNGTKAKICGIDGDWPVKKQEVFIGAAGTIARFLPGALAQSKGGIWEIHANEQMSKRPIQPLVEALINQGTEINYLHKKGYFPLELISRGLKGGEIEISGSISSQFISGLLISSPYAENATTIRISDHIVQHAYVNITLEMMKSFGAEILYDNGLKEIVVKNKRYASNRITLEPDVSTSCYFFALAALTGGTITINNISTQTNQPDIKFLDVLEKMGCNVLYNGTGITVCGPLQLKGGFEYDFNEMSDQALTLGVLSIFASDPITITGINHIRNHESDRIHAICKNLRNLGISVDEFDDGFTVYPGDPTPNIIDTFEDHRVAMSFSLLGAKTEGIIIENPSCVSKTRPQYFDLLESFGVGINHMRETK